MSDGGRTSRTARLVELTIDCGPRPVTKMPGVCGGSACIDGTRIPVWGLEWWRRMGRPVDEVRDCYPTLTTEEILAAWRYADEHREEMDREIRENEE